jgi:hypothetical protein
MGVSAPGSRRPVIASALVMMLSRLGSFNALEQTKSCFFWKEEKEGFCECRYDRQRGQSSRSHCGQGRARHVYSRLKRNKALRPLFPNSGFAVILDGHESSASFKQCCCGCLHREVKTASGTVIQFYHRHVMAILLCRDFVLLLDLEMQRPGEDEVAAASRLFKRLCRDYPRAFDMVVADGSMHGLRFQDGCRSRERSDCVLKDDRGICLRMPWFF